MTKPLAKNKKPAVKNKKPVAKKVAAKKKTILPLFLKPKPIKVVTRDVLNKIADSIFNPKTKNYLNLCEGTLQNGPDPSCESRPMHCGLGELYFVVTGKQPEQAMVNEEDVIDEIVGRSTVNDSLDEAKVVVKKLPLPSFIIDNLLSSLKDCDAEDELREVLSLIADVNDVGEDETADFALRAQRVAKVLRDAAKLLPR